VEWFKRAADQDNQWGQANLGAFLFQGRGIEQNEEEGLKWSRLAADKGNYVGQFWVGFAYDDGVGAPEDNKQAIHWYRLSADQGYAEAQYALGVMYANGEGAPKDVSKGKYYVELAADKGFRPAQSWLKEFQAGGPLTDAESQLPAIESGVSEAGSPADDLAPDVQESKLESDAIEFVRIMNADWSANDEKASKVAANVYADTVNFYGQNVTRNEIIKQKKAFLTRWPVRNYRERPEETRVSCNLVGKRCSITGIVDWQVESEIRNARSKGVSEFELEIDYSSGMPQVVMEDGRVSQREQTR
jgi:TPR repeat protein